MIKEMFSLADYIPHIYLQYLAKDKTTKNFIICSNVCAWLIEYHFKKAEMWGYWHDENPTAVVGETEGGHNFIIVEGKYIIDFWYKNLYDDSFPFFLPIEEAAKYYGDRSKWELVKN